jgi:HEAT repeat protein
MQEWISFQRSWAPPTFIERWMAYFGVSVPNRRAELAPIWLMEDDPAAVPVLRELARDSDQDVSAHAVTALRVLREDGRPGLPEFRAALHHPMVMTRLIAVEAVWDLTHEADELVPVLAELLRERDQQVRWRVEGNLHRIGAAAKAAVPAVVQALQSAETADGEVTRAQAGLSYSLVSLGPDGYSSALPYLLRLLQKGIEVGATLPDSARYSFQQQLVIRCGENAATVLGSMGPAAGPAIPTLTEALSVESLRPTAARALHRIDPVGQDGRVVDALLLSLDDKVDLQCAITAARALGEMGATAKPALPALIRMLVKKDENSPHGDRTLVYAAAVAVWRIDHQHDTALAVLKESLSPPGGGWNRLYSRGSTVKIVEEMGPLAKAVVPELTADLAAGPYTDTINSGGGAWELRENARQAKRHNARYRAALACALGAIGPDAKQATSALLAALRDDAPEVREAAALALQKIDPSIDTASALVAKSSRGDGWKSPSRLVFVILLACALCAAIWTMIKLARKRTLGHLASHD